MKARTLVVASLLGMLVASPVVAGEPQKTVGVLVATRDIPAGTEVALNDVAIVQVPAELVTSSMVQPDRVSYIVGQRVYAPVLKGDIVLWVLFDLRPEPFEACAVKLGQAKTAQEQVAAARASVLSRGGKKGP